MEDHKCDDGEKKKQKNCVRFKVEESEDADRAMKLFLIFEKNDSGALSFQEFKDAILEIGLDPGSAQLKSIFQRVDTDGNGRIDFEEFLKVPFHTIT